MLNNLHFVWKQLQCLSCFATTAVWHSSLLWKFPQWLVRTCTQSLSLLSATTGLCSNSRPTSTFRNVHISCLPEVSHRLPYHRYCWYWTSTVPPTSPCRCVIGGDWVQGNFRKENLSPVVTQGDPTKTCCYWSGVIVSFPAPLQNHCKHFYSKWQKWKNAINRRLVWRWDFSSTNKINTNYLIISYILWYVKCLKKLSELEIKSAVLSQWLLTFLTSLLSMVVMNNFVG